MKRLVASVRLLNTSQRHCLRFLSTADTDATPAASSNRETGVVKRFNKEKGYGFIAKNSDGTDCFVQYVSCRRARAPKRLPILSVPSFKNINTSGFKTLEQGQEVDFTLVQGEKGVEARVSLSAFVTRLSSVLLH